MGGCGPQDAVGWCTINHCGQCCLDSASYEEMDHLAARCGSIRVNNRYLLWKYGVEYKDLNCGNCGFYMDGICINDQVEPHIKGIKVDGKTEYVESKEYYHGAMGCKEFMKRSTEKFASYCSQPPGCICEKCLFHASGRCPYGHCYDDLRAKINPYDKAHPDKPPRTLWSKWNEEGEQAHWCRGGIFYQSQECPSYVEYDKSKHIVRECLDSVVSVFQDGYISCSLVESVGCVECMERFNERMERKENKETMTQYFTKCGREFQKSTNAETTGYHLEEDDAGNIFDSECAACPFPVDVKEGYPGVHKRWECRAGSQPPNHENSYNGSAADKCTLRVYSLDHEFCESVIAFAQTHPELGASYNQDLSDCRRAVSISCSGNRKGMAAKQELIDMFFPEKEETTQSPGVEQEEQEICDDCGYYKTMTPDLGNCSLKKTTVSRVRPACDDFGPGFEDRGEEAIEDTDGSEEGLYYCSQDDCPFNNRECDCLFDYEEDAEWSADVDRAIETFRCDNPKVRAMYDEVRKSEPEQKKPRFNRGGECQAMREDCACFCAHNDGCAVLLATGGALSAYVDQFMKDGGVDCEVFRKVAERVSGTHESVDETPEIANEIADFVNESVPDVSRPVEAEQAPAFDYSQVDEQTANYLQDKAKTISQIKIKTVHDIGFELSLVHNVLANRYGGTFGKWCESIGISRRTAENYIQAYEYVAKNFRNIEDAANIQPSLLFAASKPSAPPELQQAVIDGDITKHKDYIKAIEELKEAKQNAEDWHKGYESQRNATREIKAYADGETEEKHKLQNRVLVLEQQTNQLKQNADPEKLQELGGVIKEKQDEVDELKAKVRELNEQLNAKPIETSAVEIREVVPEDLGRAWCANIENAIEQIAGLSEKDMNRIIRILGKNYYSYMTSGAFWTNTLKASGFLEDLIRSIRSLPAPADTFIKWLESQEQEA